MASRSKPCKGCGKFFTPPRVDQLYHNEECRNAHYALIYPNYKKAEAEKVCAKCGVTFTTSKPLRQIYCGPPCREIGGENPYQEQADLSMQLYIDANPDKQPGYSRLRRGSLTKVSA